MRPPPQPKLLLIVRTLLLVWAASAKAQTQLPPGFSRTDIGGTSWSGPVGVTFDANGRMYVWERGGRVFVVENGIKLATPLVDISTEVVTNQNEDHGLLGFALHPNFLQNGWVYLLYAVDRYDLLHSNDPNYNPQLNDNNQPTIGRLTRYTARASDGFRTVDPASRKVLLGETAQTGCPILFTTHGVGSLVFGSDDSLLATCGDGASYLGADTGGPSLGAKTVQALADGIITPQQDVGAFRAQLPSVLSGKILRLDPATGDGLPSNPWFNPAQPRSPRSRVYALGFRNPFRFTRRPGTGSHYRGDGNPGVLYLGNVGDISFEELEVVDGPAYNGGWPVYEGITPSSTFTGKNATNSDAPNPLFGIGGCTQAFFTFRNLLIEATPGVQSWPNPCNAAQQVPATIPRFMHHRPEVDYGRNPNGPMRTPTFTGGVADFLVVGIDSPLMGTPVGGATITGQVWYTGTDFPASYQNSFFQTDYTGLWIQNFHFDASDVPYQTDTFATVPGGITSLATNPVTGGLYAVDIDLNRVYRISYAGPNQPPVARATAAPRFGASPLAVNFTGSTSSDPEGLPLTYQWNFGDGSALATQADPNHSFTAPAGVPTPYTVNLTVRDSLNQPSTAQVLVAVNDTPPNVSITSPVDQGLYSMATPTTVPLTATISDAEHGPAQLSCAWQTTLHQNGEQFPDPPVATCAASADLDPVGCGGSAFHYAFALTVSDAVGLPTTRSVSLYPDCASLLPVICGNLDGNGVRDAADVARLRDALANPIANPLTPAELSRCSTIGDTACNVADLAVLRRYLAGRAPGPAPVCPAAGA